MKNRFECLLGFLILAIPLVNLASNRPECSLAGEWRFRLDPQDIGLQEAWQSGLLPDRLVLPGCLQAQGYGEAPSTDSAWTGEIMDRSWFEKSWFEPYRRPGNIKVPFWLTPDRHYVGPAWYQRDFEVPPAWQGRRVTVFLERCHWATRAWVDGRDVGARDSLSTAHIYDLGTELVPGRHTLTVRVDNRLQVGVGVNAHSVSDHTQGNWNGMVGDLKLVAMDPVWIEDLQVYPQLAKGNLRVSVLVRNPLGYLGKGRLRLRVEALEPARPERLAAQDVEVELKSTEQRVETDYPMGSRPHFWDEFTPLRYQLEARWQTVGTPHRFTDRQTAEFGWREFGTLGTHFAINGRPTFLRGTLECCIFPLTGYPPTQVVEWMRILEVCRAYGLNHVRFHSWCPPEAAFAAADRLGFYLHVECAAWANSGSTVGDGQPIDQWLEEESARIMQAYGNHPSFVLFAYGNEPAGRNQNAYLGRWVERGKSRDPRRLYTSAAGWPILPENQYHVTPAPRIQQWGQGLASRINARPPETTTDYREFTSQYRVPIISHEIGQWCVYPNFEEIPKYRGYLKARNFEIFRDDLIAKGLGHQAQDFLMASGKLQALCYKEEIESALRTPGFGGFQLLDLHDFPGQGTALVGVLDPFWESKGYLTAQEHRRYCAETVPLARLPKRSWTTAETLTAELEVAHFGRKPLAYVTLQWRLQDTTGRVYHQGEFHPGNIDIGNGHSLGRLQVPLTSLPAARKYRLFSKIAGTPWENDWDLWIFPATTEMAGDPSILITSQWNESARERLAQGGKVLLLPSPDTIVCPSQIGFSPIFWNTAWTSRQPPHTLGLLCQPQHPALAGFPTEYHSNWQWWELISRSKPLVLDQLPTALRPLVQVIDDWTTNHRLGLVFEAGVAKGQLLVCGIDLTGDLPHRPAARCLRHCLIEYMKGSQFQPKTTLSFDQVLTLFAEP